MSAADPEGSPSDTGGGSSSTPRGAASEAEVIEVDEGKAVPVISPALVYDTKGEVWALPADIKAVDDFGVPNGYWRRGCRERSFMYSLGVYVVQLKEETTNTSTSVRWTPRAAKTRRRFLAKRATAAT